MRYILVFIALLGCVFGYGQYPSSGVKQRLGYQTTERNQQRVHVHRYRFR